MRRWAVVLATWSSAASLSCSEDEPAECTGEASGDPACVSNTRPPTTTAGSSGDTSSGPIDDASGEASVGGISGDSSTSSAGFDCATWWDERWKRRLEIRFDWIPGGASDELVDVPIMIHLSPSRIDYGRVRLDGLDLRFVDKMGAELVYEVEQWEHGGDSWLWVKVPSVSAEDPFYLYFDNVAAIAPELDDSVWSNAYSCVLHMAADNLDSVGTSAPEESNTFLAAGKAGLAREFPTEVSELEIDASSAIDGLFAKGVALSGWLKLDRVAERQIVLAKGDDPYDVSSGYMVWADGSALTLYYRNPEEEAFHWRVDGLGADQWHWFALSYDPEDPDAAFIMLDTTTEPVNSEGGDLQSMDPDDGYPLLIAPAGAGAGSSMVGRIDELRLASAARSVAWMLLQRRSTSDELLAFGRVQSREACSP